MRHVVALCGLLMACGNANPTTTGGAAAGVGGSASGGTGGRSDGPSAGNTAAGVGGSASGGTGGRSDGPSAGNTAGVQATAGSTGGGSGGSGGVAGGTGGRAGTGGAAGAAGWTLVWFDDFDGAAGAAVNSADWVYDVGNSNGWGNNELEYYRDGAANAALDGKGNLVITAKEETYQGAKYTSARLKTLGRHSWTYGAFEGRMKMPAGQGLWPAFWMLGNEIDKSGVGWPACGEVDIMENLGREPSIAHGTMHGPGYSGGAGPSAQFTLPGGAKFSDDFHLFRIEWEPKVIRWYVDGELYSTKTTADIGAGNTWVFDRPFFILINLAVGGGWPGNPDATTVFPQTLVVDYVKVFAR